MDRANPIVLLETTNSNNGKQVKNLHGSAAVTDDNRFSAEDAATEGNNQPPLGRQSLKDDSEVRISS